MPIGLLIPALGFAVADWVAVARDNKRAEYFLKPATMGALLVAAAVIGSEAPDRQLWGILAALVFSTIGDVFLMLPRDYFLHGLAAFLIAHICYVVALFGLPQGSDVQLAGPAIGIGLFGVLIYLRLLRGMRDTGKTGFALPVLAYALAITAMWVSAASTLDQGNFPRGSAWAAYWGAGLFVLSDSLIGYTRFVRAERWAPLAIIVTYHLGQTGLVLSLAR
ncbi:MAG TPA: lysoplasmalogenase [Actinomycetota bacterium]|nr:lysoplasmalogenase [Actinomycetota bacterium]